MLQSREGQPVPTVTFRTRENGQWLDVTTDELFKEKTVVVFALPGAFTPTCSSSHLPRYNELAEVFKQNGVDDIICISVNDAFVMEEWKRQQQATKVRLIPDGNGTFTEALGMLVDKGKLGFGKRSWRYSMLVKDTVIKKMFIEPEVEGDPFQVSDADTMLNYLNPNAREPEFATIFTRQGCPYCAQAKSLLTEHGVQFEQLELQNMISPRSLRALTGSTSVPQIFIHGEHIGGADELERYLSNDGNSQRATAG
ncbi:MAG: glutathione peroxidase [Gammaproteobacteria bacterium]|nr:glutathione peroxidase [Gammaproteobacteria bacterium]